MEVEDDNPHFLPSSIVPRIHAVVSFKLEHSNPLICSSSGPSEIGTLQSSLSGDLAKRNRIFTGFEAKIYF